MPLRPSEAGRRGLRDCGEGMAGIADIKVIEHANERSAQFKRFQFSGGCQGGAEEYDAEIGIGADSPEGRFNCTADASPDARGGFTKRPRRGGSTLDELRRRHPVAGRKDMNVARLQCFKFVAAGGDKSFGDALLRRHALAPRARRSAIAATVSAAKGAAILTRVSCFMADQPGMLSPSSTVRRLASS